MLSADGVSCEKEARRGGGAVSGVSPYWSDKGQGQTGTELTQLWQAKRGMRRAPGNVEELPLAVGLARAGGGAGRRNGGGGGCHSGVYRPVLQRRPDEVSDCSARSSPRPWRRTNELRSMRPVRAGASRSSEEGRPAREPAEPGGWSEAKVCLRAACTPPPGEPRTSVVLPCAPSP
jgi:hypothetical protein